MRAAKYIILLSSIILIESCGCTSHQRQNNLSGNLSLDDTPILDPEGKPLAIHDTIFLKYLPEKKSMVPQLPETLSFAGERVPLEYFDVRESLYRELIVMSYRHSANTYMLQLSTRWFPVIKPILKEEGIPEDFIYLCVAESDLQNQISPAGAVGFWQFMKGTAKEYNLEISETVDERSNVEKATRAACSFLRKSYEKYGTWAVAAASYNMGTNNTTKRIETQQQDNYYNLAMPNETSRYLFRILAFKLLFQDMEKYGFHLDEQDFFKPLQWRDVTITKDINSLAEFAKKYDTNVKVLKMFNPWLISTSLKVKRGKSYIIHIPKEGFRTEK